MNKIVIEIDRIVDTDNSALIMCHPTGVFYTAQCGGIACLRPEVEGYALNTIGGFAMDFDDCSFGCSYIYKDNPDAQMALGKAFDEYAKEETKGWTFRIRFDFDRVEETLEGWIPVKVFGKIDDLEFDGDIGIVHNGNCD